MKNVLSKIPPKYRQWLLPIVTVLVIIGLSATVGKYIVDNIISTKSDIDNLKTQNMALESKVQVLSGVDSNALSKEVASAVEAVPGESSTLPALATLRSFVQQRGLDLLSFNVLGQTNSKQGAGNSVEINLVLVGKREDIISLLNDLKTVAPLMRTTSASIVSTQDGAVRANVTVLSYWSPLPQTLGKADQPIETLKKNEQDQANALGELKKPESGALVPSNPQGKENPFTF